MEGPEQSCATADKQKMTVNASPAIRQIARSNMIAP
jgi:hypothetical protein